LTGWPVLSHIISQAAGLAGRTYYGNSKKWKIKTLYQPKPLIPAISKLSIWKASLKHYRRRDQLKAEQLDQLGDAIMAVIGDKVEALAEAKADDAVTAHLGI
jgi:hypothetical protein